ncbi:MAG: VWA domain-containing protein [Salinivirgaceae bacterium]|nr:VWA domain-containing protein [Salinivirgaceae bacterium]
MKNNITELIFVIDQSGSMSGLEDDTIGGFNSMLEKQRNEKGVCHISTVFFDNSSEVIHDRRNISAVEPLTRKDYTPGGSTALLDALGDAINHTVKVQKKLADKERADNVVFVIITDGEENSSSRFSARKVKQMISCEQEKYGWEFIFLGANIDAVKTAGHYGIRASRASNFVCDSMGVGLNFCCVSEAVSTLREEGCISDDWAAEIQKDYKQRGR